jgi:hypothetical protein
MCHRLFSKRPGRPKPRIVNGTPQIPIQGVSTLYAPTIPNTGASRHPVFRDLRKTAAPLPLRRLACGHNAPRGHLLATTRLGYNFEMCVICSRRRQAKVLVQGSRQGGVRAHWVRIKRVPKVLLFGVPCPIGNFLDRSVHRFPGLAEHSTISKPRPGMNPKAPGRSVLLDPGVDPKTDFDQIQYPVKATLTSSPPPRARISPARA